MTAVCSYCYANKYLVPYLLDDYIYVGDELSYFL